MTTIRKKSGLSIKDKMDSYHLYFELDEFVKSLEENVSNNPDSSVYSNGKRAWFHGNLPESLEQMNRQLRKRYNIKDNNKIIVCVYYPPEKKEDGKYKEKFLSIKENKSNVMTRFILSTANELCEISLGSSQTDKAELKSWVAYKTPDMIGGMLSYKFANERNLVLPPKKGFRQVRKTKQLDKRYVIVFDYLISKNEVEELSKVFTSEKTEELLSNQKIMNDPLIQNALKDLQSEN